MKASFDLSYTVLRGDSGVNWAIEAAGGSYAGRRGAAANPRRRSRAARRTEARRVTSLPVGRFPTSRRSARSERRRHGNRRHGYRTLLKLTAGRRLRRCRRAGERGDVALPRAEWSRLATTSPRTICHKDSHTERTCAENCNKRHDKINFFLKLQSAFW